MTIILILSNMPLIWLSLIIDSLGLITLLFVISMQCCISYGLPFSTRTLLAKTYPTLYAIWI